MFFISLTCWCGLVLLAWWSPPKCDPRASGLIKTDDQMLPAYVMQIAGHLYGVPGLFTAGIFGAALRYLFYLYYTFLQSIIYVLINI